MAIRASSTIVCGDSYFDGNTTCISKEGDVYTFGSNFAFALGSNEKSIPKKIPCLTAIKSICCSCHHTICLDIDGIVFSFGSNDCSQLGIDKDIVEFTYKPQIVELPGLVKQISCGEDFSICLTEKSEVFSFGDNQYGQLGHGNNFQYKYPKQIQFLKHIEALKDIDFVECGSCYAICKTNCNDIYGWGYNAEGQLGVNRKNTQYKPIKCEDWPDNIIDIKCGIAHTLVLTATQEVFSCGSNEFGRLGRETNVLFSTTLEKIDTLSEIIRIECGDIHSLCIDIYHNLFVFGDNEQGQLGLGQTEETNLPIKHPSLLNIIDVSSKGDHTFVKTSNNEIYAFGDNRYTQLGTSSAEKQLIPIQVFQGQEGIWASNSNRSRAKSARK